MSKPWSWKEEMLRLRALGFMRDSRTSKGDVLLARRKALATGLIRRVGHGKYVTVLDDKDEAVQPTQTRAEQLRQPRKRRDHERT